MGRNIIYGGEARPHVESNFEIILNFILRFIKAVSSAAERIFQPGFDNKKIIKK